MNQLNTRDQCRSKSDVPAAFAMMTTKDDGIIKPLITFA
jgi:hypothetical protein